MNQDSHRRPHTLLLLNGIFSKWYKKYEGNSSGLISNLHSISQYRHEKTAFLTIRGVFCDKTSTSYRELILVVGGGRKTSIPLSARYDYIGNLLESVALR